jgi:putative transposase
MIEYRRTWHPGATWFFTVNLAERRGNRLLVSGLMCCELRFVTFGRGTPFHIEAIVILPDRLHCVWTLGPGDTDFSTRWSLIKGHFSRAMEKGERISQSRAKRGERGLWQRRFWEHLIRDQADFNRHVDYVHWNPVRHGWVRRLSDWPHSSVHAFTRREIYPEDWGGENVPSLAAGE